MESLRDKLIIIIAVSRYGGTFLGNLPGALTSAENVRDWFCGGGKDRDYQYLLITDEDPEKPVTVARVKEEVTEFLRNNFADRVILYFAGHGVARSTTERFWLLSDFETDPGESISVERCKDIIASYNIGGLNDDLDAGQIAIISDACSHIGNEGAGVAGNSIAKLGGQAIGYVEFDLFFSGSITEKSYHIPANGDIPAHTLFTHSLMEGIRGKALEADPAHSGLVVTNQSLIKHMRRVFSPKSGGLYAKVRPVMASGFLSENNVYNRADQPAEQPARTRSVSATDPLVETQAPDSRGSGIAKSGDVTFDQPFDRQTASSNASFFIMDDFDIANGDPAELEGWSNYTGARGMDPGALKRLYHFGTATDILPQLILRTEASHGDLPPITNAISSAVKETLLDNGDKTAEASWSIVVDDAIPGSASAAVGSLIGEPVRWALRSAGDRAVRVKITRNPEATNYPVTHKSEGLWIALPQFPGVMTCLDLETSRNAFFYFPDFDAWDLTALSHTDETALDPSAEVQYLSRILLKPDAPREYVATRLCLLYEFFGDRDNLLRMVHALRTGFEDHMSYNAYNHAPTQVPFDLAMLCASRIRWRIDGSGLQAVADFPSVEELNPVKSRAREALQRERIGVSEAASEPLWDVPLLGLVPAYTQSWKKILFRPDLDLPALYRQLVEGIESFTTPSFDEAGQSAMTAAFDQYLQSSVSNNREQTIRQEEP